MSELRQDPSTKEWVIIARERTRRPDEFRRPAPPAKAAEGVCVSCPGNEDRTPPELFRLPYHGDAWDVRVVPNRFPAVSPETNRERQEVSQLCHRMDGFWVLQRRTGRRAAVLEDPYYLWHIQIPPRLTTPAGFEIGSGISVNPCIPEEAASFLRSVRLRAVGFPAGPGACGS